MSLPHNVQIGQDSFINLENYGSDPDFLYFQALKSSLGICERSIQHEVKELNLSTPLEQFGQTVDFSESVLEKLRDQGIKQTESQAHQFAKSLKWQIQEYHLRNSVFLNAALKSKLRNQFTMSEDFISQISSIKECALEQWNSITLKGNNIAKWPIGLDDFISGMQKQPILSQFNEPEYVFNEFSQKVIANIETKVQEINKAGDNQNARQQGIDIISDSLKALFLVCFSRGNFISLMKFLNVIEKISSNLKDEEIEFIISNLQATALPCFQTLEKQMRQSTQLHYMKNLGDQGGFCISTLNQYSKQSFSTSSIATDGSYLYTYISSVEGGMFKIGTGQNGTVAGKVYVKAPITKIEEIAWTYLKGKLYLRSSTKETQGLLDIYSCETLEHIETIQLKNEDMFEANSQLNKGYPLLSDGKFLYLIGKKIISHAPPPAAKDPKKSAPKPEEKQPAKPKEEENAPSEEAQARLSRKVAKLKQSKAPALPNTEESNPKTGSEQKEIQFILYKYDLDSPYVEVKKEKIAEPDFIQIEESLLFELQSPELQAALEESIEQQRKIESAIKEIHKNEENAENIPQNNQQKEIKEDPSNKKEQADPIQINNELIKNNGEQQPIVEPQQGEAVVVEKQEAPVEKDKQIENQDLPAQNQNQVVEGEQQNLPKQDAPIEVKDKQEENQQEKDKEQQQVPLKEGAEEQLEGKQQQEIKEQPQEQQQQQPQQQQEQLKGQEQQEQEVAAVASQKEEEKQSKEKIESEEQPEQELKKKLSSVLKKEVSNNESQVKESTELKQQDSQNPELKKQCSENGNKKDSKKIIKFGVIEKTLLGESEIVIESTKSLKNPSEIVVKECSIIQPLNASQSLWTMNEDQVTLYSEQGIKIFSKYSKDEHLIDPNSYFDQEDQNEKNSQDSEKRDENYQGEQQEIEDDIDYLEQEKISILEKYNKGLKYSRGERFERPQRGERHERGERKGLFHDHQEDIEDTEQKMELLKQPLISSDDRKLSLRKEGSTQNPKKQEPEKEPPKIVEKEKKLMKTTLIANVEVKKKLYTYNPNYNACYDPSNKIFYVFVWAHSCYSNVFPSIITRVFDQNSYLQHPLHEFINSIEQTISKEQSENEQKKEIQTSSLQKLRQQIERELLKVQQYRQLLPWKLNRWDYIYGYALVELTNQKLNQSRQPGNGEFDEKKAISRAKVKVIQRLNKQLDTQKEENKVEREMLKNKERVFRELQKDYAFCIGGGIEIVLYIADRILSSTDEQQMKQPLIALSYWILHSQELTVRENSVNSALTKVCQKIMEFAINNSVDNSTSRIISFVLLHSWKYIVRTNSDQIKWITKFKEFNSISPLNWVEAILLAQPNQYGGNVQESFPLRESEIEGIGEGQIIDKVDSTSNFIQIFKYSKVGITSNSFNEPLSRLLFENLNYTSKLLHFNNTFEDFYKTGFVGEINDDAQHQKLSSTFWQEIELQIVKSIQNQDNVSSKFIWQLIHSLLQDSHFVLLRITDSNLEQSHRQQIFKKFLDIFEKSMDYLLQIEVQQDTKNPFISEQLAEINSIISLFLELNFASSISTKPHGIAIIKQLTRLFSKMKLFLKVGDVCLAEQLFSNHAEGLDQTIEKVFETNHPYERGKVIQFEQNMFPGAIAIAVHFDKRCQSDASNDFLKIAGWYDIHSKSAQSTGYSISSREGLGKVFKLSGKLVPKRQLILLADTLQVEFHSSGHAKDEKSLSRWGYKISARPIYGMSKKMWTDTDVLSPQFLKVSQLFGNDNLLAEWLNTMKLCILTITQSAKNICNQQGNPIQISTSFLDLAILKNGFSSTKSIDKYLLKDAQQSWDFKHIQTQNSQKSSVSYPDNLHTSLSEDLQNKIYFGQFAEEQENQSKADNNAQQTESSQFNWNLQSSEDNPLLTKYIEQIKTKQGEFFTYSREIAAKLRDPMQYTHEKSRPTFTQEYKELWQQCEALILLSCLHHSGLAETGLSHCKEYILDNQQGLQETRNGIILKMLSLVQQEKEFNHIIESLIEAKAEFEEQKKEAELAAEMKKKEQEENENAKQKKEVEVEKVVVKPTNLLAEKQFVRQGKKLKIVKTSTTKTASKTQTSSKTSKLAPKPIETKPTEKVEVKIEEEQKEKEIKSENEEEEEEFKEEYDSDNDILAVEKRRPKQSNSKREGSSKKNKQVQQQQISQELEQFLWDKFQKRFGGGNNNALKQLCESRQINYEEDNVLSSTKKIFAICLNSFSQLSSSTVSSDNKSPYYIVGTRIAQKCLLLLSLCNKHSFQSDALDDFPDLAQRGMVRGDSTCYEMDIKPVGVNRSISQPVNEKLVDKEKLKSFRAWVDSYQKWKQCREASELSETTNDEKSELYSIQNYDALKSIAFFLCSHVKSEEIIASLERQDILCSKRVSCLSIFNFIYPIVTNTCFERYLVGSVNDLLGSHILQEVTCASKPLKELQQQELLSLLQKSISIVNKKVDRISKIQLNDLVGQVQRVKTENKMSIGLNGLLQEYLKIINLALTDILSLVSNDLLWRLYNLHNAQHLQEFKVFLTSLVNLGLVSTTFSFMSSRFEDIVLLVGYSQHLVDCILTKITANSPDLFTHVLLAVIYQILNKEIGFQPINDSSHGKKQLDPPLVEVNARIFLRLFDPVGQLRFSFLLQHLEILLSVRVSKPESRTSTILPLLQSFSEVLLFLVYHTETPVQVRLILRCLKPLSDFLRDEVESGNPSLFESKFFYYEIQGLSEISNQCSKEPNLATSLSLISKPNLQKKYLEFSQPQSSIFPLKGVRLLFEKIGNYILNEQQSLPCFASKSQLSSTTEQQRLSLRQSLTTLLNKVQFQSIYKNRNSSLYMSFNSDSGKKKDKPSTQNNNSQSNSFIVLGQLSEEEDLTFLLKVLYYWEELYPTSISLSQPNTVEEYLELKKSLDLKKAADLRKEALAKSQAVQQNTEKQEESTSDHSARAHKLIERIFTALPEINGVSSQEGELPIGWQFNYIGLYNDLSVFHFDTKRGKIKKKVKQVWQNVTLASLIRKMEQADKDIKDFEEGDPIETKIEIIRAKNFISRIQTHLKDIQTIASLLNIFGYGPMFDFLSEEKAEELAALVNHGIKNQLKPIPLNKIKESFRKLLDPNEVTAAKAEKKSVVQKDLEQDRSSQMVVQICNASLFPLYEIGIDLVTSLSSKESFFADANASSIMQMHCKGGQSSNNIISDTIEFFRSITNDQKLVEIQKDSLSLSLNTLINYNWETELSLIDRNYITGVLNVVGGWPQSVRQSAKGILNNVDYEQGMECILQGGVGTGQGKCSIISTKSANTAVQIVQLKNITPMLSNNWPISEFNCYDQLFKAIIKCSELMKQIQPAPKTENVINKPEDLSEDIFVLKDEPKNEDLKAEAIKVTENKEEKKSQLIEIQEKKENVILEVQQVLEKKEEKIIEESKVQEEKEDKLLGEEQQVIPVPQEIPQQKEEIQQPKEEIQQQKEEIQQQKEEIPQKEEVILEEKKEIPQEEEQLLLKEEQIHEKKEENPLKEEEVQKKEQELPQNVEGIPQKEEEIPQNKEEIQEKNEEIPQKKEEILEKKEDLPEKKEDIPENKEDIPEKKEDVSEKKEDIPEKKEEIPQKKEEQKLGEKVQSVKVNKESHKEPQVPSGPSEEEIEQIYLSNIRAGMLMRFLLQIATTLEWNKAVENGQISKEEGLVLLEIIKSMCGEAQQDKLSWRTSEEEFVRAWEDYVDKNEATLDQIRFPQQFSQRKSQYKFLKDDSSQFPCLKKLTSSQGASMSGYLGELVPSASAYTASLPQEQPEMAENKLLKYWEKLVIPKIYDFVKSTLKAYELEDFFEQIRFPLRKGDQASAMKVAYIICEKNLPAGVVLPDANHDWNTISVEDVRVGQWLIASITSNKNGSLFSPFLTKEKLLQVTHVPVLAIGIDARNAAVLCLYRDHDKAHAISLWIPVTSLKLPEQPIMPPASCYQRSYIQKTFFQSMIKNITVLSRQVLLQFFSLDSHKQIQNSIAEVSISKQNDLLSDLKLSFLDILRSSVIEEVIDDPIFGWIKTNGSSLFLNECISKSLIPLNYVSSIPQLEEDQFSILRGNIKNDSSSLSEQQTHLVPFKRLRQIQQFIDWLALRKKSVISELFDHITNNFKPLVSLINKYVTEINIVTQAQVNSPDGQVQNSNNSKPFRLFQFEGDDAEAIGSIVLAFRKDALLGVYSGLKFFSDELGINKISQLNSGKQSKKLIEPMMFRGREVFCSYYFNKHQLSPFEADTNQSQLPCIIYGVPKDWNMNCWLIDTLASSLMKTKDDKESLEKIGKIMSMLTESFDSLCGPSIVKQLLAKLIIRTARKLRFLVRSQIYSGTLKVNSGEEVNMHWKILGVKSEFVKKQVAKIKEIRSFFKQDQTLHSSFTQDYMEMVCTLLVPLTFSIKDKATFNPRELLKDQIPRWLEYGVHLQLLMNFFENNGILSKEIQENLLQLQLQYQTKQDKNLVLLTHLPTDWTNEQIKQSILSTVSKSKMRILTPTIDILIFDLPDNSNEIPEGETNNILLKQLNKACLILLDGPATLDLEEVALEKKKEEEAKAKAEELLQNEQGGEKQPAVPTHPETWTCDACTLQNPWDSQACEACEFPKPENAGQQDQGNEEVEQGKDNFVEEEALSLEDQIKGEHQEEEGRVQKFCELIKVLVQESYSTQKQQKEKENEGILKEKAEIDKKFNEEKVKLEAEIEKIEVKERKKQEKLKLEEAKKLKKSQAKKVKGKQVQVTPSTEELIIDPILKQLQEELKDKKEATDQKIKSLDSKVEQNKNFIVELDQLKAACCQSVQGRQEISDDEEYHENLDVFIRRRYLEKDTLKLKSALSKKLEKRIQSLPASVQQSILQQLKIDAVQKLENGNLIVSKFEELASTQGQYQALIQILDLLGMDLHLDTVMHIQGEKISVLPISQVYQMLKYIEGEVCKETKMVLKYNSTSIRFHKSSFAFCSEDSPLGYSTDAATLPYTKLTEFPLSEIRLSWALLKLINKLLESIIQLINMSSKEEVLDHLTQTKQNKNGTILPLSLSDQLSTYRSFWMSPIKIELSQRVFNMTAIKRDSVPKVQVERLKLQRESDAQAEIIDTASIPTKNLRNVVTSGQKDNFLFTKAFDQIKDLPVTLLRPMKPTGTDPFIAFETIFKGELVMGEAGPYRQFFADISSELQTNILSSLSQSRQLNLMVPSTNNLSKSGDARDKYVINPSAKSSYQLQLFEFLGILMGTCVRTGTHLTLDLPKLLWKLLVGEQIIIEDLEEIDKPICDMIKFIDSCDKQVFQESFFETYTTTLSDFSTVELKKSGQKINVTFEDRYDYIARAVEAKVHESSLQIQAIKTGLNKIIPASLLSTVLASDLEMWVCGRKRVDFDLLKRHTIYSVGLSEETPHIKFLWEVLQSLEHKEALRFVKFCWGQERLPANDEEFERNQIRFMIKPTTYSLSNPDLGLPKADTCFFNLELPAYTTKTALMTKLLLAINTDCDSMNAENPIALDPDQGYNGDNGNDSSEEEEEENNPDGDQYNQNQFE